MKRPDNMENRKSFLLTPRFIKLLYLSLSFAILFPTFLFSYSSATESPKNSFPLQQGFPIQVEGYITTSVVAVDVNGDQNIELSFLTKSPWKTYLYNNNGIIFNKSWPIEHGGSVPTIANFDRDDSMEIVTVYSEVNVWNLDGSLVKGWPYIFSIGNTLHVPAVADLDGNGFNDLAIDYDIYFVILNKGSPFPGYPVQLQNFVRSSPAIIDINNDGTYEIATANSTGSNHRVYVWDLQGNLFNSDWEYNLNNDGFGAFASEITVADIDGDFRPEIMFCTIDNAMGENHAVVIHHDRTIAVGWPKTVYSRIYGGLSAGDIDGDGKLEVAGVTSAQSSTNYNSMAYVWNGEDGTDLPGWPQEIIGYDCAVQNVIIGDLDGDCDRELLFACLKFSTHNTQVYAYHHDGTMMAGFPITINGYVTLWSNSCFITDMDNDGDVEIGLGVNNDSEPKISRVYVWDLPGAYNPDCIDWPQYNHDAQHTGNYHHPDGLPVLPVPGLSVWGLVFLLLVFALVQRRSVKEDRDHSSIDS